MEEDDKKTPGQEDKGEGKSFRKRVTKRVVITLAALTGLSVATVIAAKEVYDYMFRRYDRPDYSLVAGVYCIERTDLIRREMHFMSDGTKLCGYYYPCEGARGLVVLCHGIHAGADDYLPMAQYFVSHGYAVFSFDYKGTYGSEGDRTVGMCESLVDLDHALDYIKTESAFAGLPVFLVGHSWGGYAASSVLALHGEVKGCACISAPNSGYTLILEKGEQYAGKLGSRGIPELFLNTYQKYLFGGYTRYDGAGGINSCSIPVLIAHGKADEVIDIDRQSIVAHRENIRTENVTYYLTDGAAGGHNSIWHSPRAAEYIAKVDSELAAAKKRGEDEAREYIKTVDHALYSEVNTELFDTILKMFDGAPRY